LVIIGIEALVQESATRDGYVESPGLGTEHPGYTIGF